MTHYLAPLVENLPLSPPNEVLSCVGRVVLVIVLLHDEVDLDAFLHKLADRMFSQFILLLLS